MITAKCCYGRPQKWKRHECFLSKRQLAFMNKPPRPCASRRSAPPAAWKWGSQSSGGREHQRRKGVMLNFTDSLLVLPSLFFLLAKIYKLGLHGEIGLGFVSIRSWGKSVMARFGVAIYQLLLLIYPMSCLDQVIPTGQEVKGRKLALVVVEKNWQLGESRKITRSSRCGFVAQWLERATRLRKTLD